MALVAPAQYPASFSHLGPRRGSTSTQSSTTQESSVGHTWNQRRASRLSERTSSDKDTETSCNALGFFGSVHSQIPLLPIHQVGRESSWGGREMDKGKELGTTGEGEGSSGSDHSPPLPIKEYASRKESGSSRREPRDEAFNIRRLSLVSLHSMHSSNSFRSSGAPSPKRRPSSLYSNPLAPLQRRLLRSLEHPIKSERAEEAHAILIELLEAITSFLHEIELGRAERAGECILELTLLVGELIEINVEWKKAFDAGLYGPLSFVASRTQHDMDLIDTGHDWWPRRLRRDCRCVMSWGQDNTLHVVLKTESVESLNYSEEESTKGGKNSEERAIKLLLIGKQRWAAFRAMNTERCD